MKSKNKNLNLSIFAGALILSCLFVFTWRDSIRFGFAFGWDNLPTHAPSEGCSWERKIFQKSGISFYVQDCKALDPLSWNYSEDSDGKIVRTNDLASRFTMETFTKRESQAPMDVMKEKFSELTSAQQKACQIQSADEPIEYLSNGTRSNFESPHPTPHKTRYEIAVKPEIVKGVEDKYGGLPDSQQDDYLCGKVVGSPFVASAPYFEFDDRSPDKYLFVGSLGNDGSVLIDLNSIRFE
jgi:hypothetical protein